jgi:hypothetical protein
MIKILNDSSTMVWGNLLWNKNENKYMMNSQETVFTKVSDATYLNTRAGPNHYKVQQFSLRKSNVSDQIHLLIWDPHIDEFERLVANHKISGEIITKINEDGRVETDSVIVDQLSEEDLTALLENKILFNYRNVMILRRIMEPLKK